MNNIKAMKMMIMPNINSNEYIKINKQINES